MIFFLAVEKMQSSNTHCCVQGDVAFPTAALWGKQSSLHEYMELLLSSGLAYISTSHDGMTLTHESTIEQNFKLLKELEDAADPNPLYGLWDQCELRCRKHSYNCSLFILTGKSIE